MIFVIHRSWEPLPTTMFVGPSYEHVGRMSWSGHFREPFCGPLVWRKRDGPFGMALLVWRKRDGQLIN